MNLFIKFINLYVEMFPLVYTSCVKKTIESEAVLNKTEMNNERNVLFFSPNNSLHFQNIFQRIGPWTKLFWIPLWETVSEYFFRTPSTDLNLNIEMYY